MQSRISALLFFAVAVSTLSFSQSEHFNFGAGAGFTVPTDGAGRNLNTGWNFDIRGGVNVMPEVAADLDFLYTRSDLNSAALARFNEPGGSVSNWSLTFNPVIKLAGRHSPIQPYVTAGYGLYYRNLQLTRPATVQTLVCDPFFGFCFPAPVGVNEVVASNSTLRTGFNAGGGFDFRIGQSRAKLFAEARYHQMFTAHGHDFTYVPVTFGVRF